MDSVSNVMYKVGIAGVVQSMMQRWALGYAFMNPGHFVTILMTSQLLYLGSNSLSHGNILQHIEQLQKHFVLVTSNLKTQY